MRKIIILLSIFIIISGCKAKKTIQFCEGVSTTGEGVKCGEIFSAGELTALIKIETPFNINKINVDIYKKGKYKSEKIDSLTVEVKPDENSAKTNFYFYDEGDFTVEVLGQEKKKIAEGSIKIVEE